MTIPMLVLLHELYVFNGNNVRANLIKFLLNGVI